MNETPNPPCPKCNHEMSAKYVTVCSACKKAECWEGKLYCEKYRSAGTEKDITYFCYKC